MQTVVCANVLPRLRCKVCICGIPTEPLRRWNGQKKGLRKRFWRLCPYDLALCWRGFQLYSFGFWFVLEPAVLLFNNSSIARIILLFSRVIILPQRPHFARFPIWPLRPHPCSQWKKVFPICLFISPISHFSLRPSLESPGVSCNSRCHCNHLCLP